MKTNTDARFTGKPGYRVEFVQGNSAWVEATSVEDAYEKAIRLFPDRVVGCLIDVKEWINCVLAPAAEKAYLYNKYF